MFSSIEFSAHVTIEILFYLAFCVIDRTSTLHNMASTRFIDPRGMKCWVDPVRAVVRLEARLCAWVRKSVKRARSPHGHGEAHTPRLKLWLISSCFTLISRKLTEIDRYMLSLVSLAFCQIPGQMVNVYFFPLIGLKRRLEFGLRIPNTLVLHGELTDIIQGKGQCQCSRFIHFVGYIFPSPRVTIASKFSSVALSAVISLYGHTDTHKHTRAHNPITTRAIYSFSIINSEYMNTWFANFNHPSLFVPISMPVWRGGSVVALFWAWP